MSRRNIFKKLTEGDALPAALLAALALGSVPTAVADYVTAKFVAGPVSKITLTLSSLPVTMTDATTAGCHGSTKVFDFAACNLLFLGGTTDLTTLAGSGGIADTAALVGSVGTAAVSTADATLTTTEADLIPSTSGTLTAGAGTLKGKSVTGTVAVFDGTAAARDAYLNLAVPDAGSTGNDTIAVSGTITLLFANLGDN